MSHIVTTQALPSDTKLIRRYFALNSVSTAIQRYFTQLDPVANAYYELASPITLTGDFEVEIWFSTAKTTSQTLVGTESFCKLSMGPTGTVSFLVGNGESWVVNMSSPSIYADGKLHHIKGKKVGQVYTLFVDGDEVVSQVREQEVSPKVSYVGTRSTSVGYFNGILSNLIITDKSGVEDVVTTFPIGLSESGTEYSDENTFGEEKVVDSALTDSLSWTEYNKGGGTPTYTFSNQGVTIDLGGSYDVGVQQTITNLTVGSVYEYSIEAEITTNFNSEQYLATGIIGQPNVPTTIQSGLPVVIKRFFTAIATSHTIILRSSSSQNTTGTYRISDISIREIQGNALTRINVDDADIELFEKSGNQWDNISSLPQELPAVIQIATQA